MHKIIKAFDCPCRIVRIFVVVHCFFTFILLGPHGDLESKAGDLRSAHARAVFAASDSGSGGRSSGGSGTAPERDQRRVPGTAASSTHGYVGNYVTGSKE